MTPASQLESVLFFKSEPLTAKELAKMLGMSEAEVKDAAESLKTNLQGRGLTLISEGDAYMLATAPEASQLIERITKEELEKDPGKAGMEVLAIILYQGPQTRAQIDHIRGVNSTFALRQLMIRGLLDRIDNPTDQRSFLYKPTLQLLSFLGVSSTSELPDFEKTKEMLASLTTTPDTVTQSSEHGTSTNEPAGSADATTIDDDSDIDDPYADDDESE
ncbi:MAG: segregation and condensation protein [Patescibacteria group bacterium]|jgi:segregation and condensation protein B|nr:segregation and condensation protein [Patescibacteria group bacterium]